MLVSKSKKSSMLQIGFLVLFIIISSTVFLIADGYAPASKDSLSAHIDFVSKTLIGRFGMRFKLDKFGIPTSITGELSKGLTATDPIEQAYQFFDSNKDLFPIENAKRELIVWQQIGGDEHFGPTVKFYWCVDSVRIHGATIILNYSRDGKLYNYDGKFDPEARKVDTKPTLDESEAKQIVVADKRSGGEILENTVSDGLIIIKVNDKYHLTWAITSGPTSYWIDAKSGAVVKTEASSVY
jgi:Zn-dependent metalloprotease